MAKRRQRHKSIIQKVDHRGDYIQLPRALLRSSAMLSLSHRARATLFVLLERWNSFNNGEIGLSIENLGQALGNQNHRANSLAIVELIDRGIVECMTGPDHHKCKAREYRLTFISTGEKPEEQATNEWRNWHPRDGNFGPEATAVETWKPTEATATRRKLSTEATATQETETRGFGGRFRPEATATHIVQGYAPVSDDVGSSFFLAPELRAALNALIASGKASAADIAKAINMPTGTMSKFRHGRNLPEHYRGPLHWELGRRDAFKLETSDAA